MKLGIGTVQFGMPYGISNKSGKVATYEVSKILRMAEENGIQILDTAAGYGNSESIIGENIACDNNFSIVTKTLPLKKNAISANDVVKVKTAFENSLRNLKQRPLYGLLVHHSGDLLNPGGDRLYSFLRCLKEEGRVCKIGVSVYSNDEIDDLFERYSFDVVQLPMNVFDQRMAHNGLLQSLHAAGVEIHVRSAFLQGLLLMPTSDLPPFFNDLRPHHKAYLEALLSAEVSPLAGALGYFQNRPEVSTVLVGVENCLQLHECLIASRVEPSIDYDNFVVENPLFLDPRCWK